MKQGFLMIQHFCRVLIVSAGFYTKFNLTYQSSLQTIGFKPTTNRSLLKNAVNTSIAIVRIIVTHDASLQAILLVVSLQKFKPLI